MVLDVEFGVDVIGVIVIAPIVTVDVLVILLLTAEIFCFLLCILLFEFSSVSSILRFVILLSLLALPLSACCLS